jgi:hypothetical protein
VTRAVVLAAGVLLLLVGAFYAFNAYIQLRERGFTEAADIPIAVAGLVLGALALFYARRRPAA